jgi:hypothetical protein
MAAFRFRQRRTRRWWYAGATLMAAAFFAVFFVVGASATLPGSTFNTANGDLTTVSTTIHDWNPAGSPAGELGPIQTITCPSAAPGSGTNCALDLVGSSSDNSLGQGTKEDDVTPTVVDGQIPPNKDDLSRFYINQEVAGSSGGIVNAGDNMLYLAWERSNLLGSAHMDFELNQNPVGITPTTTGTVDINRTPGDVLIDFDFGGSGVPVLQWHKWLTTANAPTGVASADCDSSTTLPCWSVAHNIGAAGEASVNGAPVNDYNNPVPTAGFNTLNGTTTLDKNGKPKTVSSTFGEAGIDLQASGIFSSFQCTRFGDAWLKSRSAGSSFVSELKDFIAPLPINISNCAEIKIIKNTDTRNQNKDFSYSTNVPSGTQTNAATFSTTPDSNGPPTTFTLNDRNDVTIGSVTPGDPTTTITTTKPVLLSGQPLANGDNVTITGSNTTPSMNATFAVSNVSSTATTTTFSIPFATSAVASPATGSLVFNTEDIINVVPNGTNGAPATYTVTEGTTSGWALETLTCTASTGSSGSRNGTTAEADITVVSGGVVTCTYTNQPQLGAIKVIKNAKNKNCSNTDGTAPAGCSGGNAPLAGAEFEIWQDTNGCAGLQTLDNDANQTQYPSCPANTPKDTIVKSHQATAISGTAASTVASTCFSGLAFATNYIVHESSPPSNYAGAADQNASISANSTCTSSPVQKTFTDTPLSRIEVKATSLAGTGITRSQIVCQDSSSATVGANSENGSADGTTASPVLDDTDELFGNGTSGLTPGTYTCTVVIDP